jgi:hypothetical protein
LLHHGGDFFTHDDRLAALSVRWNAFSPSFPLSRHDQFG